MKKGNQEGEVAEDKPVKRENKGYQRGKGKTLCSRDKSHAGENGEWQSVAAKEKKSG